MQFFIKKILVVCIGNICRSPMAEGIIINMLAEKEGAEIAVKSAGLGALVGQTPDDTAQKLMGKEGIDISGQRAKQLGEDDVQWADLILVMDKEQKETLQSRFPTARGKVFLIGEWTDIEIPDPYRREEDVFITARDRIREGASEWVKRLG